jgi:Patatin-like phospholipase
MSTIRAPNAPPSRPASFNEAYANELRALRPKVFDKCYGAPCASGDEDDPDRHAQEETRARDLADIFKRVGTELTENTAQWDADKAPLSALCLSGGGIRSATFNLGMLQGLARARLLEQFDYLSSVSGGGFVAGWLKAWMHHDGSQSVIEQLRATAPVGSDPLHPEPKPLDQLRHYSNYLTPRVGIFSPDTWTIAALVLRNLLLNWLVIIPVLAAVVSVPQIGLFIAEDGTRAMFSPVKLRQIGVGLAIFSMVLGFIASYNVHRFRRISLEERGSPPARRRWGAPERSVAIWAVLPLCLSAVFLAIAALAIPHKPWCCGADSALPRTALFALIWTIGIPLAGWLLHRPPQRALREFVSLLVSGAISGAVLIVLAKWGIDFLTARPSLYVVLALPLLLADYLLARALFVGLAGDRGPTRIEAKPMQETWEGAQIARATLDRADHDREWWARFSGWLMAIAICWALLSVIGVLAFDLLRQVGKDDVRGLIAALGGVSGITAAILGKSGDTKSGHDSNDKSTSRVKEWALLLAAPTFVALLLVLLSQANITMARRIVTTLKLGPEQVFVVPALVLIYLGVAGVVGMFVNVNRFSLHGLYRNRLVRAYLGASNKQRHQDPFTGFAHGDNIFLRELWRPAGMSPRRPAATRPFPVINAALNLVTGEKLAWQQRKAESFSMTPFHCGNFHEGYRRTSEYGGEHGVSLGTAMTISGAAANPNMGYHSSAAVTFLMALFNARLGSWLGNTNEHGTPTYRLPGPKWAVKPLFSELLGMTTSTSRYINLSDGGHFDNLGLYEMVLRRCRYILVSDAGRDPKHGFEDLGNAIRKIRIDFGIPVEFRRRIEIQPRLDGPDGAEQAPGLFCAVAEIKYSVIDGTSPAANGWLVYVKPALRGRGAGGAADAPLPYDVFSYAQRSKDFPHETTNDQWFDEAQFESYRALGLHIVSQLTAAMRGDMTPSLPELRWSVLDYMGEAAAEVAAPAVTSGELSTASLSFSSRP